MSLLFWDRWDRQQKPSTEDCVLGNIAQKQIIVLLLFIFFPLFFLQYFGFLGARIVLHTFLFSRKCTYSAHSAYVQMMCIIYYERTIALACVCANVSADGCFFLHSFFFWNSAHPSHCKQTYKLSRQRRRSTTATRSSVEVHRHFTFVVLFLFECTSVFLAPHNVYYERMVWSSFLLHRVIVIVSDGAKGSTEQIANSKQDEQK